jgi:hypothetical protein
MQHQDDAIRRIGPIRIGQWYDDGPRGAEPLDPPRDSGDERLLWDASGKPPKPREVPEP